MTKTTDIKPSRKKTVFRRITGIIGYLLIFLIAALFIFVIVFKVNNRTMFIFGRAPVWVMSPSMEPTIPERSYILVRSASADEIQIGDVIMFKSSDPTLNGANNTHRVVAISDDRQSFTTKGDANLSDDSYPVNANNIVAVYERNLPVLTAIGRFLFSGIGIVITLTLIFVIIMIIYLPDVIKATREKSKELEDKRQAQIEELVRAEVEKLRQKDEEAAKKQEEQKEDAITVHKGVSPDQTDPDNEDIHRSQNGPDTLENKDK